MSTWQADYLQLISDCEDREERLTDWERKFVDSLRNSIEAGVRLTTKQESMLDTIWNRATARG